MTPTQLAPALSIDQARDLADDLIRGLAEHLGDTDALNSVFLRWLDVLDQPRFTQVCMVALQTTFAECLTPTPVGEFPPGGITLTTPKEPTNV